MSRSDRSLIVAAIFGLAAISFGFGMTLGGDWTGKPIDHANNPKASPDIYRAAQLANTFAAYPIEDSNSCYNAKNHDSADLCAQWRAAIAAEKSANLAKWSNFFSFFGVLTSIIGIIAIYVTIRQTKESIDLNKSGYDSFIDIEIGKIVIKISNFHEVDGVISFDIIGTNIGRSSSYVRSIYCGFFDSRNIDNTIFFGKLSDTFISAGSYEVISNENFIPEDVKRVFLHGHVIYDTPLFSCEKSAFVFEINNIQLGPEHIKCTDWTIPTKKRRRA